MIQIQIWNFFFLNILLGMQLFYIHLNVPLDLMRIFSKKKLAKKIIHFYSFAQKNLIHFMNLNLNDIENNMLPQHSQKSFSLYKFLSKHVSVWCQKKHLQIWCSTISWRALTTLLKYSESKCLYISVYLRKKIFVPEK